MVMNLPAEIEKDLKLDRHFTPFASCCFSICIWEYDLIRLAFTKRYVIEKTIRT
jgi:hypothetical protein